MKLKLHLAVFAATVILLSLNGPGRSSAQSQVNNPTATTTTPTQVTVKPTTGKLIVRVYSDTGNFFSELLHESLIKQSSKYGVEVYVESSPMGMPPLREPLTLFAPGKYRVSVAYPNRKDGYFSITTAVVQIAPGGGDVIHLQPNGAHGDWSESRLYIYAMRSPERMTSAEIMGELQTFEEHFKNFTSSLEKIETNNYYQQLENQYRQLSGRVMLVGLDAWDQDSYKYTTVSIELTPEQIRWVGRSIKDEYRLDDNSDQERSYASRAIESLEKAATRARDLGDERLAQQSLELKAWIIRISARVSSVIRGIDSVVNGLVDRLDKTDENQQNIAIDPRQQKFGTTRFGTITGVAFADETHAFVQTLYRLDVISTNDGEEVRKFEGKPDGYLWVLQSSSNSKKLFSSGGEGFGSRGFICEWNVNEGKPRRCVENSGKRDGEDVPMPITGIASTTDGSRVLTCSGNYDSTVKLWNTQTWTEVWAVELGRAYSVATAPDGRLAAVGLEKGAVAVIDIATGRELRRLNGLSGKVSAVIFSSDGKRIVSGDREGAIRVWDAASGKPLLTLTGHIGSIERIVLANKPNQILSGGEDGTVRLWDISTGEEIAVMKGHTGRVKALAVSATGTHAISGGDDRTWRYWQLPN
jgi:WD domain, G-beta repeat